MKPLYVLMPDDSIRRFDAITAELDVSLRQGGTAVEIDGDTITHQYSQRRFADGWLLDNCPINVIMGMGWLPGQIELLEKSGINCAHAQEYIEPGQCAEGFRVSDDGSGCVPLPPGEEQCPFGYKAVGEGCDRDWNVSAEAVRSYYMDGSSVPMTDDAGSEVTMQTQTSVTPHTTGVVPSGGAPGTMPWGTSESSGEPGEDVPMNLLPFIALGALILLARQ